MKSTTDLPEDYEEDLIMYDNNEAEINHKNNKIDQETLNNQIKPFFQTVSDIQRTELQARRNYLDVLTTLTAQIDEIESRYENHRKNTKERFNVFNCLTRHHLEELHSKFIHYLLNPRSTHDCEYLFLTEFVKQISLQAEQSHLIDPIQVCQFELATVEREKTVSVNQPNDTRLDIYIETPTFIIAIENKIEAGEMKDQIRRYVDYCRKQNKKYLVVYLTKTGVKSETAGNEKYLQLSYKSDIIKWLEQCTKQTEQYPNVTSGLKYYLDLLSTSILNLPPKSIIMDLSKLLLEKENLHLLKYSKEFIAATGQISKQLRIDFFIALAKELIKCNKRFTPVSHILTPISADSIWDNKNQGFTCFEPSLILSIKDNIRVYLCIEHNQTHLWYGLFAVNIDAGTDGNRIPETGRIKEIMSTKLQNILLKDDWWFCTRYFSFQGIEFLDNDLNYELATNMDVIVVQFVTEVCEYLSAWEETIKEYNMGC